jgi:hypothetical protein
MLQQKTPHLIPGMLLKFFCTFLILNADTSMRMKN